MRRLYRVSAKPKQLCICVASAAVFVLAGCAGPSLSSRSFPALTWGADPGGTTTGSINPNPQTTSNIGADGYVPDSLVVEAPRRVEDRQDLSHLTPPRAVKQHQTVRSQPRVRPAPVIDEDLATYDPLPRYARADRKRNQYRWNGSHQRSLIDNRPPEARKSIKSQVIVDAKGRRSVRVARGDTLFGIANRYGLTTRDLMAFNAMARPELRAGQILALPAKTR